MKDVAALLSAKTAEVWSVAPQTTVYEAIKLMETKGIGALVVLDAGALAGVVSERDYARKVILKGRASSDTRVEEIMTRRVYYTYPEQDIDACLVVMTEHHIRHLPVMQGETVIGMISMGDVVKEIIREQRDKIKQLEHYINWEASY
ncbi:MAG: CBS domain-containing protein [Gammaproteobacteria bacterium]